jgi:hypothetical protein
MSASRIDRQRPENQNRLVEKATSELRPFIKMLPDLSETIGIKNLIVAVWSRAMIRSLFT